jgi:hypothetical protein
MIGVRVGVTVGVTVYVIVIDGVAVCSGSEGKDVFTILLKTTRSIYPGKDNVPMTLPKRKDSGISARVIVLLSVLSR